jgi:hypothetical protein
MGWIFGMMLLAGGLHQLTLQAQQRPDPMFPDGREHDFGSVPQGTQCKHTFRLVNTGSAPLQIVSLRSS